MFQGTPVFHWEILTVDKLDSNLPVYRKMVKYELSGRSTVIVKISNGVNHLRLNKILMKMGFVVDVVCGESMHADCGAIKDLNLPPIYSWFWDAISYTLIRLPLPKIQFLLPAFGRKRLHIRLFEDKVNKCWYITSHVDNTNLFSLRIWDLKDAINCHLRNKIEGDYKLGQKLFVELLEKHFHELFINII